MSITDGGSIQPTEVLTMPRTTDPETFKGAWEAHVSELSGLKMTLPPEKFDELDELQEELRDLIDDAVDELEDDDL